MALILDSWQLDSCSESEANWPRGLAGKEKDAKRVCEPFPGRKKIPRGFTNPSREVENNLGGLVLLPGKQMETEEVSFLLAGMELGTDLVSNCILGIRIAMSAVEKCFPARIGKPSWSFAACREGFVNLPGLQLLPGKGW